MNVKQVLIRVALVISNISLIAACSLPVTSYLNNTRSSSKAVILVQATQLDNNIPENLYPCLPKRVRKLRLFAHTTNNNKSYYLVGVYNLPSSSLNEIDPLPEYQETLVALDDIGCLVIVPKEKLGAASLTQYIPEEIARELKLQRFRQAIVEAGGKQKLQKLIWEEENHENGASYFFPEEAWALQQLGIQLPPNIKIVNDFENFEAK
jgi:hypothetical protein